MADSPYSREGDLQEKLEIFFRETFNVGEEVRCKDLTNRDLLKLKGVLSVINNTLTFRVTRDFVLALAVFYGFSEEETRRALDFVNSQKPNANGFDVVIDKPCGILAEVKCNVPVGGGKTFGSSQLGGVLKDFEKLVGPKSRTQHPGYAKFMAFPDLPNVRDAFANLAKNRLGDYAWEYWERVHSPEEIDSDTIYVAFIDFGDGNELSGES